MANFDPQDGGAVIAGLVLHVAPQGDPYTTTSINPSGAFLDTGNLRTCKDGDYIRQLKDLTGGTVHMGQATASAQPILRTGKRNGPYFQIVPPNRQGDGTSSPGVTQRLRVSDISAATSEYDAWVGSGVLNNVVGGTSGFSAKVRGLDSGWMYVVNATGAFTVGETLSWTDNNSVAKTCVYRGPTEGLAYLDGPATSISAAGGTSIYMALRAKPTTDNRRSFWFSHNGSGMTLGVWDAGGSGAPKLTAFVGGNTRACTNLCPSHSPQIYSVRSDTTNAKFSMGDQTETVTNTTATPTGAQVPRIGAFTPGGSSHWPGAGDYYYVLIFNVKLSDADHARVVTYLRTVTDIQEPIGLLSVVGHSITAGESAGEDPFWAQMQTAEANRFEIRVNAQPGFTQSSMRTAVLDTTGNNAWTAPYLTQSNYRYKVALLAGLTNNYGASPDVPASITALSATIATLQGQGHSIILSTDIDKFYVGNPTDTTSWRAAVATSNPLIRAMGFPVADFAAISRLGRATSSQNQEYMFDGYVHPNKSGHTLMAQEADRVVGPILYNMVNGKRKRKIIL